MCLFVLEDDEDESDLLDPPPPPPPLLELLFFFLTDVGFDPPPIDGVGAVDPLSVLNLRLILNYL